MKQTAGDILRTERGPNQSVMAIMIPYESDLPAGDYKIVWDRAKDPEVEAARKQFDDWKRKKYLAYSVNRKGDRAEMLREFDPEAEAIIFAPPLVGG